MRMTLKNSSAFLVFVLCVLVNPLFVRADASSTPSTPLVIEGNVDVPSHCEVTDTDNIVHTYDATSPNAYIGICALDAAQESGLISSIGLSNAFPSLGLFVESINDVLADSSSQYWALFQNGEFASAGISTLPIAAGDTILIQLHDFSDTIIGDQLTLHINSLIATSTPEQASTVTVTIRDGDVMAFTGNVEIAAPTTAPVDITPSNGTTSIPVAADSLLATLVALDAAETEFDITDLAYFSSFGSFIINCISFPSATSTNCFNWTYAVNGAFPQVGIDDTILEDGDVVHLFFGPPRQTVVSTSTATIGEEFTATAQSYDLSTGTYIGASGVTLGVGIANPDFTFTEFATSTSDAHGNALFSMNATGTFAVGIQEDFYFPATSITIIEAATTTTSEETPVPAPSPVDIVFEVHTATTTLFSGPLTVEACPERPDSATSTVHGFCAFAAAGLPVDVTWGTFGAFVTGIGGVENSLTDFWLWFLNGDVAPVGIDSYLLEDGDSVLWTIGREPLKITVSNTSPQVGGTTTVTVVGFDPFDFAFEPVASSTIVGVGVTTNASGTAEILATSTAPFTIFATADGFLRSSSISITPTVETPAPPQENPGQGGGSTVHIELNIPAALSYLGGEQEADGSFGLQLFTDWAAISFAAAEKSGHTVGNALDMLRSYLTSSTPTLSNITDYERHAMALMALGINPYSGSPLDSITPIVDAFDGTQIGSPDFENDDMFALFPLLKAGYTTSDEIIQDAVAFIVSRQGANGSWVGSVDLTAAAIQALSQVKELPGVNDSLTRAESYLRVSQKSDGGFGNSFSTSWTLQAIAALGQLQTNWMQSNKTPEEYLASLQQTDGGIEEKTLDAQTRLWATEFAIPAALEQSWPSLLFSFSKPDAQTNTSQASSGGGGGGGSLSGQGIVLGASTSTVATTTLSMPATTTASTATSSATVSTSTSEIFGTSTTTAQTTQPAPQSKPKVKKPAPKIQKILPEPQFIVAPTTTATPVSITQTASAGPSSGNFFSKIWRAVTSFFSFLF